MNPLGQGLAFDELHHQCARRVFTGRHQPVDDRDIRVVQRREQLGLAFEPREALRIVRERVG